MSFVLYTCFILVVFESYDFLSSNEEMANLCLFKAKGEDRSIKCGLATRAPGWLMVLMMNKASYM